MADLPERFWSKVSPEPNSGCWLWTAATTKNGYGKIDMAGRTRDAHRLAYETLVGPVPAGLELDHRCRTRCCVNPAHLEPVTRSENVRRSSIGDVLRRHHAAKTHCPAGHQYDEANTYRWTDGYRRCRACIAISNRKSKGRS